MIETSEYSAVTAEETEAALATTTPKKMGSLSLTVSSTSTKVPTRRDVSDRQSGPSRISRGRLAVAIGVVVASLGLLALAGADRTAARPRSGVTFSGVPPRPATGSGARHEVDRSPRGRGRAGADHAPRLPAWAAQDDHRPSAVQRARRGLRLDLQRRQQRAALRQ